MGHFPNIEHHFFSGNITSQCNGKLAFCIPEANRINHFPDGDNIRLAVWHFNSDSRFIWDRRFNTHPGRRKVQCNVVRQASDLADLHPSRGLKFIPCNRWAAADVDHTGLDAKAL